MQTRFSFEIPSDVSLTDLARDAKCEQVAAAAINQLFMLRLEENRLLWRQRFETEFRGLLFSPAGECLAVLASLGDAPHNLMHFRPDGGLVRSTPIRLEDYRVYAECVFGLDSSNNWARASLDDPTSYEILGRADMATQTFLEYSTLHDTVICSHRNQLVTINLGTEETHRLAVPAAEIYDIILSDCQSLLLVKTNTGCFMTRFPEPGTLVELRDSRAWRWTTYVEFCRSAETVILSSCSHEHVGLIEYDIHSGLPTQRTLPTIDKEFFVLNAPANSLVVTKLSDPQRDPADERFDDTLVEVILD